MNGLDTLDIPLEGVALIEASAGTGKTHTITTLVLRLLVHKHLALPEILVVTFTNAATAELRERIRLRLGEACRAFEYDGLSQDEDIARLVAATADRSAALRSLRDALGSMDQAGVFTIHGLCQRVLEQHAFESGVAFDLELSPNALPLLREVVEDLWSAELDRMSEAQIRFLERRGVSLPMILALVRTTSGCRAPELVPAAPSSDQVERALERFVEARLRARFEWSGAHERVEELLVGSAVLSRAKYRPESVRDWLRRLVALLDVQGTSTEGWFDECVKLSTSVLRDGTKTGRAPPVDPFFDRVQELCDAHAELDRELEGWLVALYHRVVEQARVRFRERKQIHRTHTFDDLLGRLAGALRGRGGPALSAVMRTRWRAVLIDEFQDTDPVQYEIFRSVYAGTQIPLFLIGDPKQAIYAFRGADVFTYLEAARDPRTARHTLGTNYRSDPGLLSAVNALFSSHPAPFLFRDIGYAPVAPRRGASERLSVPGDPASLHILFLSSEGRTGSRGRITKTRWAGELPGLVAGEIARALASGATLEGRPLCPSDLAVLTRTNEQAFEMQQALSQMGIPSALYGDRSVLDSEEAAELDAVVRALLEPLSSSLVRGALVTRLFGLDAQALDALGEDGASWDEWLARFSIWHTTAARHGVARALRQLMRESAAAERLAAQVGGERRLTNVLHLIELLGQVEHVERMDMLAVTQWFDEVRHSRWARDEATADSEQLRLESDEDAVRITTIHRSKGLEFPWVFCPTLWDAGPGTSSRSRARVYHDRTDPRRTLLRLPGTSADPVALDAAREEELAESLRLVYVALTRASHRVSVVWGRFSHWEASALGHLLHGPEPVRDADDASLLAELHELERRAQGSIRVEVKREVAVLEPTRGPRAAQTLSCRSFAGQLVPAWLTSSFTALTASHSARPMSLGEDHDYDDSPAGAVLSAPASAVGTAAAFAELPPGPATGQLLHSVLEQADFQNRGTEQLTALFAHELERSGLGKRVDPGPLAEALLRALRAPLRSGSALALASIDSAHRLSELEFVLPVAMHADGSGQSSAPLTPDRLARALDEGRSPAVPADYGSRLARLGFAPLRGFLHGFIDLVFEHQGRWFLVDYKSNRLGDAVDDYAAERLGAVMAEHHYVLQYHLYTVALHRLLSFRDPGYDYDSHFGGVFYLFLRGLCPERAPECGVYFDRPSRALVERLGGWCGPVARPAGPRQVGAFR
ncbi:MAG: exodeoxyribonuclease V subunit beta [Polyangiaceae bacterium]|nr:exodeoxyribonuclease V subunit beta [Polyangiaceae bacterium]